MAIWHNAFSVQEANALSARTAMEHLGVEITESPVSPRRILAAIEAAAQRKAA